MTEPARPSPRDSDRVILCMKWGTKYGPEYVNRLYGMVRRHLSGDFRFVCLTDDPQGLRAEVECHPIPELALPAGIPERGWKKLTTFEPDLYGLRGTALFLDVDVVIVGSLDAFFEHPGEFLIIHDWKRPWRITGNSSVYRFRLGHLGGVLSHFRAHQADIRRRYRNEQAYLSAYLHERGLLAYWPRQWCASYKYHCLPRWPSNYWRQPQAPADARVLVFHGTINPPDAIVGTPWRWRRYARPAPWVAEHWRE